MPQAGSADIGWNRMPPLPTRSIAPPPPMPVVTDRRTAASCGNQANSTSASPFAIPLKPKFIVDHGPGPFTIASVASSHADHSPIFAGGALPMPQLQCS